MISRVGVLLGRRWVKWVRRARIGGRVSYVEVSGVLIGVDFGLRVFFFGGRGVRLIEVDGR